MSFPLLALGAFLELEILALKSFAENSLADAEDEKASEVAVEALGESCFYTFCFVASVWFWIYCYTDQFSLLITENIRTVAAFAQENAFATAYETHLLLSQSLGRRRHFMHAAAFAYSQSIYLFVEGAFNDKVVWALLGMGNYFGKADLVLIV